jgi:hypothetical protein
MQYKAAVLFAFVLNVASAYSADIIWRNPTHGSYLWREISATPDAFYVPGLAAILKSTNGHDWKLNYQATRGDFLSIAQSPEKLIAVGGNWDHPDANPVYPAIHFDQWCGFPVPERCAFLHLSNRLWEWTFCGVRL